MLGFKPIPMQRVSIHALREDAPRVALTLARTGVFGPDAPGAGNDSLDERPAQRFGEVYASARTRFEKISTWLDPRVRTPGDDVAVVDLAALDQLDERLGELWREFSKFEERVRALEDERRSATQLRGSLEVFRDLDIDLGLLRREMRFVELHVGTVPRANLRSLEHAMALAGHMARRFHLTDETAYVVIAGPRDPGEGVRSVLQTAGFRALTIPAEFADTPDRVDRELAHRIAELDREALECRARITALGETHRRELEEVAVTLRGAAPYAELAGQLCARGGLASVEGWVPRDALREAGDAVRAAIEAPVLIDARDPLPEERASVPTVVRHPRLLRPFHALVRTYGVPRYGEIDPTLLFAVTFVAMFGMMFGDIGHGAVIATAAFALRKRFPRVPPIAIPAGVSSIAFGFLYGSVFGYEEIVHPLWASPLADPMRMLLVALGWGIFFVLVAAGLSVYNLLVERRYHEALFDERGLAGIALYLAGLYAAYRWMEHGVFGVAESLALAAPLTIVLAFKWRHGEGARWERALVVLVEGFEAIVKYLANTLSFLRVAAFSLNHVALAVAVFTVADMLGTTGHWLMVVLGNAFIIALEGAIVTIQVLRLEYYEGFSRFFRGDGREFNPLRLPSVAPPE